MNPKIATPRRRITYVLIDVQTVDYCTVEISYLIGWWSNTKSAEVDELMKELVKISKNLSRKLLIAPVGVNCDDQQGFQKRKVKLVFGGKQKTV